MQDSSQVLPLCRIGDTVSIRVVDVDTRQLHRCICIEGGLRMVLHLGSISSDLRLAQAMGGRALQSNSDQMATEEVMDAGRTDVCEQIEGSGRRLAERAERME